MKVWDIHGIVEANWAGARLFPRLISTPFRLLIYTLIYDNHMRYGKRERRREKDRVHMGRQARATFFNSFLCTKRTLAFGRGMVMKVGFALMMDGWITFGLG